MKFFLLLSLIAAVTAKVTSSASWYYENWCGSGHQYLDDSQCAKKFPSSWDREWTCPASVLSEAPSGYQAEGLLMDMKVDTESLSTVLDDSDINLCMVLTKRVADETKPEKVALYHKYFCLGERSASKTFETWSSSKIFAAANAAGHLRSNETTCADGVYGVGGGVVSGKHGNNTQLGDLVTVICSYDHTAGYTSNSLSSYFHDIGWRERINTEVLQKWLQVPETQTLGGNYGEATPSDLGFVVSESSESKSCTVDKDPWPTVYSNSISALTAVELTRRLVHHREMDASMRFPGVQWADVQSILYGAEASSLFPGQLWGGMTADTAIFLQSATSLQQLLNDEKVVQSGDWRIFSKLGAGYSTSRYVGEIVSNAHVCVPAVSGVSSGLELTITVRGSIPQDSSLSKVDARVQSAMNAAVNYAIQIN